ncbi:MAG: hypothetical protein NTZ49_03830 [Candidatus Parcubacteria bacterium]|nr:hypothetical protein [Candidatus Parcubacteria bacterium]
MRKGGFAMKDEGFRPFVNSAIIGGVLWCISAGPVHAYLLCLDWVAMGPSTIVITGQQVVLIILTGLALGFSAECAKFVGSIFESQLGVLLLPGIAGAIIGGLQGKYIGADFMNSPGNLIFKPEDARILSGAVIGFIFAYPAVIGGIFSRRIGKPY